MKKTNFDLHLEQELKDSAFADRFHRAWQSSDVALQLANLRQRFGLSQQELARRLKTSQQQISRMESLTYQGHSLSMLRRVAKAMNCQVRVSFVPTHKNLSAAAKAKSRKNLIRSSLAAAS